MEPKIIELTTGIVASYLENNNLPASEIPNLIKNVHTALSGTTVTEAVVEEMVKPTSAQIRKSITDDYLVSFIDGRKYKTLKRHLSTHGLTFPEYRERFGLPRDYPTVSPSYSAQRSAMAKSMGLGQGGRGAKAAPAPVKAPAKAVAKAEAPAKAPAKAKTTRAKKA